MRNFHEPNTKIFILIILTSFSFMSHIFLCEWETESYRNSGDDPLFGYAHNAKPGEYFLYDDPMIRLKNQYGKNNLYVILFGVIFPIGLILFGVYLYLGWKLEIHKYINESVLNS